MLTTSGAESKNIHFLINNNKVNETTRDSNIELVRIIAMSMIVIFHFIIHSLKPEYFPGNLYYYLIPWVFDGVNLFFLISGYFLIKLSLKSIFRFLFIILIFQIVNILILHGLDINLSKYKILFTIIFPASAGPYWFLEVYYILLITAPIINLGLETLSKKKLSHFCIIFSFIVIFSCGIGDNMCNPTGFSYIQALYLYVIGFFIRKNKEVLTKNHKFLYLLIFLISTSMAMIGYGETHREYFRAYNNIFTLSSSISLFIWLTSFKFRNKFINSVASCSLGLYLLQDGYFGRLYFRKFMEDIFLSAPTIFSALLYYFLIFIGFWIASWIITKVIFVILNPLLNKLSSITIFKFKINELFSFSQSTKILK